MHILFHTAPTPSSNIAAVAGSVAGGVLIVVLIILGTLVLSLVIRRQMKKGIQLLFVSFADM